MIKELKTEIKNLIDQTNLECAVDKFQDTVDWSYIASYCTLSENFIETFKYNFYWSDISIYQKLSGDFIEKFQDEVEWDYISKHQKLSENFIEKYEDKVNWHYISQYQILSETFIEKFKNKVNWHFISKKQILSEKFIEKYKNKIIWHYIIKYQKLSKEFRQKYDIKILTDNWLYASIQRKLNYIKEHANYEVYRDNGGYYLKLYKSVRKDYYSTFNFQYKYEVGKTYESTCDCNLTIQNSFGFGSWTKEKALKYYEMGKLLLIKVYIKDIGAIVHDNNKVRSFKLTVLEEITN